MVSDDSFAFLLPVIMMTFGFVFLVLSRHGHRQSTSWALGYLSAGAAFSMPFAPATIPAPALSFVADGLFMAAFYFYGSALFNPLSTIDVRHDLVDVLLIDIRGDGSCCFRPAKSRRRTGHQRPDMRHSSDICTGDGGPGVEATRPIMPCS